MPNSYILESSIKLTNLFQDKSEFKFRWQFGEGYITYFDSIIYLQKDTYHPVCSDHGIETSYATTSETLLFQDVQSTIEYLLHIGIFMDSIVNY